MQSWGIGCVTGSRNKAENASHGHICQDPGDRGRHLQGSYPPDLFLEHLFVVLFFKKKKYTVVLIHIFLGRNLGDSWQEPQLLKWLLPCSEH